MRGGRLFRSQAAIFLLAWGTFAQAADFDPDTYLAHIKYLASPELKGRATGSPELEKAAAYIAGQFEAFGIKPVPETSGYEQAFTTTVGSHLGTNNHLQVTDAGKKAPIPLTTGYVPFSFSSSGTVKGDVVFAGYGITSQALHYDDYDGIDVKGKIVLILRHAPQESNEKSIFHGKDVNDFTFKAVNAKQHGASGVILINDVYAHGGSPDDLMPFGLSGRTDLGIPFVQLKEATAEGWIKLEGHNLHEMVESVDKDLKPRSFTLSRLNVDLAVDVVHDAKTVHNVAAYIPGKTSEYVIVGAHYDHLGLGDENSLAPSQIGQIHFGADDNASGTAGVIEMARYFSHQPKQLRGILFMTFAGEEWGLLGSGYYTAHPLLPLENAVAMLNMDMIGRIRDGKVYVNGTETGSTLRALVDSVKAPVPLHMDISDSTTAGGSDHMSFTKDKVPVLFFFSGLHGDYHKPSDTWDKIDAKDATALLGYVAELATRLENDPGRPAFQRPKQAPQADPSGDTGGGSGYGPSFGSIPDFDEPPKGVRFADIMDGTPAAKAGLKAKDILIEFDGKEIGNLYDFTYALRAKKPGDEVLVKVLRGSQIIEAKVLLTERR